MIEYVTEEGVLSQLATLEKLHPRDPKWERESRAWLVGKTCALCGGADHLQVHHVKPYHRFPALEMDPDNWWPLCMHPVKMCHYGAGHWRVSWLVWNPDVREDTADWSKRMGQAQARIA